jgi:hypothetical protein
MEFVLALQGLEIQGLGDSEDGLYSRPCSQLTSVRCTAAWRTPWNSETDRPDAAARRAAPSAKRRCATSVI